MKAGVVPFELYSDVILTRDFQECDLRTADVGTVVERHGAAGYSVEFFNMVGNTTAVVAVSETALRRLEGALREGG